MVSAMANDDDKLTTYSAAAKLLGRNRRTVQAALEGLTPDQPSKDGAPTRWQLSTIKAALERRDTLNADYVRNDAAASSTATLTRARATGKQQGGNCRNAAAQDGRRTGAA